MFGHGKIKVKDKTFAIPLITIVNKYKIWHWILAVFWSVNLFKKKTCVEIRTGFEYTGYETNTSSQGRKGKNFAHLMVPRNKNEKKITIATVINES